ncbi:MULTISPECIES: hypothetical protein [Sporosarcina]|uniref:Spore coat protein n=1 Tax=Sporosarcina contaminans TaxID=633403 RepID=A0ABW3TY10_9BACL
MDGKMNREQLQGLSGQLMELFVADLFTKNKVNVNEAKSRMTDEQRERLKQTVEQLKVQVEDFLATKNVQTVTADEEETVKQVHPLRDVIIQMRQKKESNKNKEE